MTQWERQRDDRLRKLAKLSPDAVHELSRLRHDAHVAALVRLKADQRLQRRIRQKFLQALGLHIAEATRFAFLAAGVASMGALPVTEGYAEASLRQGFVPPVLFRAVRFGFVAIFVGDQDVDPLATEAERLATAALDAGLARRERLAKLTGSN